MINDENKYTEESSDYDLNLNIGDQIFLVTLLMMVRGNTIKYSSIKKRQKNEQQNKIGEEIKELEDEINNNSADNDEILNLAHKKEQLVEVRKDKIEGVTLLFRCRYQDLGEEPS